MRYLLSLQIFLGPRRVAGWQCAFDGDFLGLLKRLKKQRKKEFAQLENSLSSDAYKKLAKQFKQWSKRPAFQPAAQQNAHRSAANKLVPPLTELLQHPGWHMATQKRNQQSNITKNLSLSQLNQTLIEDGNLLHDLRKRIKGVRYQTEFFRGLYGITYAAQVREFRSLQKVLGQLQDQLVIADFLVAELGADWAEKLPTIYADFQNSRLSLWKQWQPLQQKYLKLSNQLSQTNAVA
ncbi:MAG: CHAD domain-containing protein [Cyanobacteria bacterium J06632_3]